MRIEVGQMLGTSYETGPYRVARVTRGCTCTHYLDSINGIERPLPPHLHLRLTDLEGDEVGLNYYDEATLRSYGPGGSLGAGALALLENDQPIQTSIPL
jgi:hypothetical protein